MAIEAVKGRPCDGSKASCTMPDKRGCTMPRGQALDALNAKIRANFPKVTTILCEALCIQCCHRGRFRGCQFGFLPLTEDGLFTCPHFRKWGDWRPRREVSNN
jgi:hypothetical protein